MSRLQNRVAMKALAQLSEECRYDVTIKSETWWQLNQDRPAFFPETARFVKKLFEASFRTHQPLLVGDDLW
jgi:hypothetical protein